MAHNPAAELASAIQSVSIQKHPDPDRDINPSTASSKKIPAVLLSPDHSPTRSISSQSSISSDIIRPRPRTKTFPPIPDFRFEQSYLASIKNAESNWTVAYITIRDQVMLPLTQGILWNMLIVGWRHWNRGAKFGGKTLGAKIRRWWWDVNNWEVPEASSDKAGRAQEFFMQQSGTSMGD